MSAAQAKDALQDNLVTVTHRLWAQLLEPWIEIHMTGSSGTHVVVTNNPGSELFHRALFSDLRAALIEQSRWPFQEVQNGVPAAAVETPGPRFRPISLRGNGPSASELLLQDRERLRP